ncbi:MAG: 50S ribosomal protein L25 [Spirochaetia bacterium]
MDDLLLTAEPREEFGKGATNRMRRAGKIPAVVYGVSKTQHILLNADDFNKKFRYMSGKTIVPLDIASKKHDVLVKDYHYDIVRDRVLHVDLYEIKRVKEVKSQVPVKLVGVAIGQRDGGVTEQALMQLEISSMPMFTPKEVEIDITSLKLGDSLTVAEIKPVENVTFVSKSEAKVVSLVLPKVVPVAEADE